MSKVPTLVEVKVPNLVSSHFNFGEGSRFGRRKKVRSYYIAKRMIRA